MIPNLTRYKKRKLSVIVTEMIHTGYNQCKKKIPFNSAVGAANFASQIDNTMHAYPCPECLRWHVGHPKV